MKFVDTYDVNIGDSVWTMGLSTCMFLCLHTKTAIIGWHFGAENMNGHNMKRVSCLLHSATTVTKAYLVPGIDREKDLSLKQTSRTMRYRPGTIPTQSRDWLLHFLAQFAWFRQLQILNPVQHYKEIVTFDSVGCKYTRDDALFDKMCIQDADTMI